MRYLMPAGLILAVAACNSEAPKPTAPDAPASMKAGNYEVASEVTGLTPGDKSAPATSLKLGQKSVRRSCIAADGILPATMFMEAGDSCTIVNSFVRSGRLSIQYRCTRKGKGELFPNVDGNYTADGFIAIASVGSSFPGTGDYTLTRRLTARRVGDCPAGAAR